MAEHGPSALGHVPESPLLRASGIVKSFGGVRALRGVSLTVLPGEVHALLGENGAGKSTLIKILSGVHAQDGGTIEIARQMVSFTSPAQSREAGVAVVYQDLSLVESLTVADNLMLGREPRNRFGLLRKRQLLIEAERFLKAHRIPLEASAPLGSLPFAYRQMTEIAKALMGRVRLLVLDEPTSALTKDEEEILFDAVRTIAARGVGVIYVTHRLNEVFRISQRVTVFRDGANAGTFETAETDMRQLVSAIVGPEHAHLGKAARENGGEAVEAGPAIPRRTGAGTLELRAVCNDRLRGVDLSLGRGEIHGLAGMIGSGRTEILETIFGLRPVRDGEILLDESRLPDLTPAIAIKIGMALVPEDRHVQGLVLAHSIERNLTLPRLPAFSKGGWVRKAAAFKRADRAVAMLAVKAPSAITPVKNLSGGNQQKVVFGKWSEPLPRILLLDEPTVGVDVGAREDLYGVVRSAAAAGASILLASSDLAELLTLCHRISIVVDGRVLRTLSPSDLESAEALHHLLQTLQAGEQAA